MIAYFDTSALVKLLIAEESSREAALLWSRAGEVYASRLAYPEALAALAAAHRGKRLSDDQYETAVSGFMQHFAICSVIGISDRIVDHAAELAPRHGLTAADAVHLATALAVAEPDTTFVTWDKRLWQAVIRAGLPVAPMNL